MSNEHTCSIGKKLAKKIDGSHPTIARIEKLITLFYVS